MAKYRIAEFIENNVSVFFVESSDFIEIEFLKYFTRKKIVWKTIEGQPIEGFNSIADAGNFINDYKKTLPKYHYVR